jgi:hypothetical protein
MKMKMKKKKVSRGRLPRQNPIKATDPRKDVSQNFGNNDSENK